MFDEFTSYRQTKYIIKHYEQASFLNMEVGVFHSHAYPFDSCKMTSQTVEEKTLTNKLSLVPFLFSLFSLPAAVYITSFSILYFSVFSFSLR